MKKPYTKPMVTFEDYSLDMPIAAGCDPDYIDVGKDYAAQDWFADGVCEFVMDSIEMGDDKLCYYTVSTQIFTS